MTHTNASASIEDYLGAIFRLQGDRNQPLPLSQLQEHFGFSPISIHEMVQKLAQKGLAEYFPYKGVRLTAIGEKTATSLVRRHRVWEFFLANELNVPIDEAHDLAGSLEHAVPDWVTERLYDFLGQPESCPHGSQIGEQADREKGTCLADAKIGQSILINRISPENPKSLKIARQSGLIPGKLVEIIARSESNLSFSIDDQKKTILMKDSAFFWGKVLPDGA